MDVIYRAFDGKEFYGKEECINYENSNANLFQMYDNDGPTQSYDCAQVVVLPDERGLKAFIKMCELSGVCHDGIDDEMYFSPGAPVVFVWDEGLEEYREISPLVLKALKNIL